MFVRVFSICGIVLLFAACKDNSKQGGKPIVLGDSSSIVTETDPAYLGDYVDDIQIREIPKDTVAPETQAATDTTAPQTTATTQPAQPAAPKGSGLTVGFKEVTVFIPGIKTKTYRNQDPIKANGATYQLEGGNLVGNQITVSGANVTRVSQRYITRVVAENDLGTLNLDALGTTTSWSPLKGNGKTYAISGLEPNRLEADKANQNQIRNAVSRAARSKRMSRQNIQKWEQSVRNVRSVNQAPLSVELRSVMWKIEGKDASGKIFQKQIRIDL